MKQTKLFFLVAALLVTGAWLHTTAQVKIGGSGSPASGAVLDLSAATAGGLLLPQVTLTTATSLPDEWIGTVANTNVLESGLIVYNLGGGGLDAGVYVWQGTNGWIVASGGDSVTPAPDGIVVTADPAGVIAPGETQTLTATISPINAGWTTVNWGGNDTDIAMVVSTGLNTATVTGVALGNTTVIASLDGVSASPFDITVNPILASGVTITGGNYDIHSGGGSVSRSAAIVNAAQATNQNINWTSNNAAVTVSPTTTVSGDNVTITVASGALAVNATVTATAADASGLKATIAVTRAGLGVPCTGGTVLTAGLCWTTTNQSGGTAAASNSYGSVYVWSNAAAVCTAKGSGWRLPTLAEYQAVATNMMSSFTSALGGVYTTGVNTWGYVGSRGYWWTNSSQRFTYADSSSTSFNSSTGDAAHSMSVRCVKAL